MRCFCPISGVEYYSSTFFKEEPLVIDRHPIFRLPARTLLAKARKYGRGQYSPQEEKLLFLALLNTTEAMFWEVPAEPEVSTVKKYLEQVFRLVAWYVETKPGGSLRLPQMRVSSLNYTLSNIGVFIQSWYEVRKEWMAPSSKRLLQELLEKREHQLYKLIHSHKDTDSYASRLASWAMEAGKVHPDRKEEWTQLFLLKPDKGLFSSSLEELLDMQDHMQRELYAIGSHSNSAAGSIYSAKVLEHIHKLVEMRKGGMLAFLGGEAGGVSNTFRIKLESLESTTGGNSEQQLLSLEAQKEELEKKLQELGAAHLTEQPKKEQYPGKIGAWIKDNANWVLSGQVRENLKYVKERIELASLDKSSISDTSDSADSENEDNSLEGLM